ncbi:MAG: hypothetical protein GY851_16485 [bacterium]|nr:hypothetical protein [bacterium]
MTDRAHTWKGFGMRIGSASVLFAAFCASVVPLAHAASDPQNLAGQASVTVSGQYNEAYGAERLRDGHIADAMSHDDAGKAWCIPNAKAAGAEVVFRWPKAVPIADIVYYGRTAWEWEESFRGYEIYLGRARKPVATGRLKKGHGAQCIHLPEGARAKSLRIRFTSHYGGSNPGAAEIRVYGSRVTEAQTGPFTKFAVQRPPTATDLEAVGAPLAFETPALMQMVAEGALGFCEILAVQRYVINSSHVYTYHCEDFRPGGGLFIRRSDGELTRLVDAGDGQILDCDVSFDGEEILFSWRKNAADTYQVYRIRRDGSELTQLTDTPGEYNFNACWLPTGDIVFLSTRKKAFAYCWNAPVGILHRMHRDGSAVRRISSNYLNDFTPSVLEDGRIAYGRWEYVDRPAIPIQGLWTIHPDGTNLRTLYGNRVIEPGSFLYPHAIPGTERYLCLLTGHNGPCLGAIGVIDPRRGVNAQAAIRNVTPEITIGEVDADIHNGNHVFSQNREKAQYTAPYPVDDRYFLVTRAGSVVLRDYDGTEQATLVPPRDGMGFYEAKPMMARNRPHDLPDAFDDEAEDVAYVYLRDVYKGLGSHVARGEVTAIRVVQEIEKPVCVDPSQRAFGFQFPVVSCGATYAPKRVWGDVPVEADGSAAFEVPAGVPIYFMALDAQGRAVQRMRSFTHLMPGERQGCVGCHESRLSAGTVGERPRAFTRMPAKLTPPEWGVRGFSYPGIVQPVLDKHCVPCHSAKAPPRGLDLTGDKTEYFNVSYELLARAHTPAEDSTAGGAQHVDFKNPYTKWIPTYNGSEENLLIITPKHWGAHASKLAEIVAKGHPDSGGTPLVRLSDAERRRIYAWIDLNVPYYGTSDSNDIGAIGCRYVAPGFDSVLEDVAKRRCAECHTGGVPRRFFTRVTNVTNDPLLLAPLAKEAGGTEACGRAVFASTDDPDYQALVRGGRESESVLNARPRMDVAMR